MNFEKLWMERTAIRRRRTTTPRRRTAPAPQPEEAAGPAAAPEPEAPPDPRVEVGKLIAEDKHYEAMQLILEKGIADQFNLKDIASKLNYGDLFNFITKYHLDPKSVLTDEEIAKIMEDIKYTGRMMMTYIEQNKEVEEFMKTPNYQAVEDAAVALGFDFAGYTQEYIDYAKAHKGYTFHHPDPQVTKTEEDMNRLRQQGLSNASNHVFPHVIRRAQGSFDSWVKSNESYKFALTIDSTDTIFPEEIFQKLDVHHAGGAKPIVFVIGSYTPGVKMYVDEIQSDVHQRYHLYMQSQEEAKAKLVDRIKTNKAIHPQTDEIKRRIERDEDTLGKVEGNTNMFMPQYKNLRSKFDNYFKGWNVVGMNAALNLARQHKIPVVYLASADLIKHKWTEREFAVELYKHTYDDMAQEKYGAVREGEWWKIELKDVMNKIASVRIANYEQLYKEHPREFPTDAKELLLKVPEVKAFVDENVTSEEWGKLTVGFWTWKPWYDETNNNIYLINKQKTVWINSSPPNNRTVNPNRKGEQQ